MNFGNRKNYYLKGLGLKGLSPARLEARPGSKPGLRRRAQARARPGTEVSGPGLGPGPTFQGSTHHYLIRREMQKEPKIVKKSQRPQ